MAELDSRFALLSEQQRQANLHKNGYMSPDVMHDEVEIIPQELINDLVFHGFPSGAFTSGIPPFFPMGHPLAMPNDSPESARIRTLASTHRPQENSGDATLTWGSEVEMPSGANISPPKSHPRGPTINVQPPTESNARTRLASIPSRTDPRTPVRTENDLVEEIFIPGSGMAEKSLPDTPDDQSHSVRSQAPSPENGRAATTGRAPTSKGAAGDYFEGERNRPTDSDPTTPIQQYTPRAPTVYSKATGNGNGFGNGHRSAHPTDHSAMTQDAVTAPTHFTHYDVDHKRGKDIIHVKEAVESSSELGPWDHVTQKLYAWALVWEDESFTKALESLALGKQVEVIPLTVFSMMTYKR